VVICCCCCGGGGVLWWGARRRQVAVFRDHGALYCELGILPRWVGSGGVEGWCGA
jgi:hypothetical protein